MWVCMAQGIHCDALDGVILGKFEPEIARTHTHIYI